MRSRSLPSSPALPSQPIDALALPHARQPAVQRAQVARGFSFLLGKADRLTSVGAPAAFFGAAVFMLAGGAAQMYTKPGSN